MLRRKVRVAQRLDRPRPRRDGLIFLTAAKAGIPVLTANRDEFDLIQRLAPAGRFIHCRAVTFDLINERIPALADPSVEEDVIQ